MRGTETLKCTRVVFEERCQNMGLQYHKFVHHTFGNIHDLILFCLYYTHETLAVRGEQG